MNPDMVLGSSCVWKSPLLTLGKLVLPLAGHCSKRADPCKTSLSLTTGEGEPTLRGGGWLQPLACGWWLGLTSSIITQAHTLPHLGLAGA